MRLNLHRLLMPFAGIFLFTLALTTRANAQQTPTVTTDQADYPPGSTAIITGSGFQPGETVTLQVLHDPTGGDDATDPSHQPWTVTADGSGSISSSWVVPGDADELGATLKLTAIGESSGLKAEWMFTDASNDVATVTISSSQTGTVIYGTSSNATYTVTITPNGVSGAGSTTLSLTGTALPTGATAVFSTNPVSLPSGSTTPISVTLTITNTTTTPAGSTSAITVQTSGSPKRTSNDFSYVVSPKALSITAPSIASKVYDGSLTSGTVTVGTLSGFVGTQTVTATATGTYPDANVGTGKTATVVYTLANGTNGGLGSNYSLANGSGTGNITQKALTAASTVASKVYDGITTAGAVTLGTVTGLVGSETLTITPSASNYSDANVGTSKSTTISYSLANGTGLASNYSMVNLSTTGAITAKALTAASTVASKVYDGNTTPGAVTLGTVTGLVGSETLTITPSAGNYANANVGASKSITISYSLANGTGLASNYIMANLSTTGAITAKALTAASTVASKVYDGTATPGAVTLGTVTGLVGSETLVITPSASNYGDANVGTGKSTTISYSLANGTGLASNYSMANLASSGDITSKALTAASTITSKVYDGNTTPGVVTLGTVTGLVVGQTLTITPSASNYSDANVGTGKSTTISYSLANGTGLASNYNMANLLTTGAITKKALTITAPAVASKVYDGSATSGAVTVGTLSGLAGSETLVVTATGQFTNAGIGSKTATIIYSLADGTNGGLASNYSLANGTATGTITAKPLTITGVIANNKVYDGTTTATLNNTSAALVGVVSGDNVMLNAGTTASFDDKNVGNGKSVTASGYTLGGNDKNNYTLSQPTGLSANISTRAITGSITASNKVYDGNTSATIITRILSGVLGSDDVSYVGGTATFANANAGIGKTVTATGLNLSGADAGNYSVNSTATTTADITKVTATLDWVPGTLSQIYNGSVKTVVATTTPSGLTVNYTFVGTPQNVGAYPVTATINDINYQGSLTGTLEIISPATTTTVTSSGTSVYGESVTFTATVSSLGGTPGSATVTFYDGVTSIGSVNSDGSGQAVLSTNALNAGDHTITASYSGAGIYLPSTSAGINQHVDKAASVTTVTIVGGSFIYTGSAITPATVHVTGAGGLDMAPTANYTNNVNAGTATASYDYAGDANHEGSSDSKTFDIGKASSTTVVTINGGPFIYTGSAITPATVSVTGAGGLSLSPAASYNDNTDAGTATASYNYAGDANHEGSSDSKTFDIGKASSTTVVTINGGPFIYTGSAITPAAVSVTGAGGLSLTPAASYSDNTDAGTATASYTFAGDANHEGSSDSKTFDIGKASTTTVVTINGGPFIYTGSAITPATVSVTGAGGLTLSPAASYSDNTDAGTATASYNYAGDANHNPSSDSKDFTIGKAASVTTVSINGGPFIYTGSAITPATVSVTGAGGLSLTPTASYSDNTNAGTATASYMFAGDANHEGSSDSKPFDIGKASSTTVITINGGPFTYTGLAQTPATVSVTGAGGLSTTPDADYANNVNAGTATASYTYAGDDNHSGSSDSKTFDIGKADAHITITAYNVTWDGNAHTATFTAVGVESTPSNLAALMHVSGTTHTHSGDYPLDPWGFDGNSNYNSASGTVHDVINPRPIVIATSVGSILCNGGSTTLTVHATGGDGTPYLFKLGSGSCQTDSNFIVSAGPYTITVKDAEGLMNTANITVVQPTTLTATVENRNPHLYYGYSGDQLDTINVTPSGGTGPYSVSITIDRNIICNYINDAGDETWTASSGGNTINNVCGGTITGHPVSTKTGIISGTYSVYLKLLDSAVVTTTVTDKNGCTYIRKDSVFSEDVRCFAGNTKIAKVQLCHRTGSLSNPCVTICVDSSAVAEHLAHGDSFGPCPKNGCGTSYNSSAPVIAQTLDLEKLKVSIMPNPSVRGTDFRLTTLGVSNQEIQIRVLNMLGKEVYSTKGAANETYKFGANFLSGVYLVVIIQNNNVQTLKIIKQ